ncbi:MAG: HEAT repeat domain-containing protein, partial [Thermoguttaceae bacterium]
MQRLLTAALLLALPMVAHAEPEASWHGKPAQHWIDQLSSDQVQTRWYATYALGQIGAEMNSEGTDETVDLSAAVGPLTEILADPDRIQLEYVRGGAAWALGRIGPMSLDEAATRNVVRRLIEALDSQLVSVRRNAPIALGNFGEAADPAVDRLVGLLGDDDAVVRVNGAVALWKIRRHSRAVPTLAQMARGGDATAAFEAIEALGHIGPDSDAV